MSNARFAILQARAVSDKRLSNAQFRTLATLGTFGDEDGWCYPKLGTMGDMLGKSRQAVSKDLQVLAELDYVEIHPQFRKDGSRSSNLYRLKFDNPCKPDVDTLQDDVDTHQPQRLTPPNRSVDTPSTSEVDALTTHVNVSINDPLELFLSVWKTYFPDKPQPRAATKKLRDKFRARWRDDHFREIWKEALYRASQSATCKSESWFDVYFFLRNEVNYQKCFDRWMDWKDRKAKGNGQQQHKSEYAGNPMSYEELQALKAKKREATSE